MTRIISNILVDEWGLIMKGILRVVGIMGMMFELGLYGLLAITEWSYGKGSSSVV
jgi:hypothetical protein